MMCGSSRSLAQGGPPEWKLLAPIVRAYVPSDNEAQTKEDLIRPVLRALGYAFMPRQAQETSCEHRCGW
jgi:hypothetical protein